MFSGNGPAPQQPNPEGVFADVFEEVSILRVVAMILIVGSFYALK